MPLTDWSVSMRKSETGLGLAESGLKGAIRPSFLPTLLREALGDDNFGKQALAPHVEQGGCEERVARGRIK